MRHTKDTFPSLVSCVYRTIVDLKKKNLFTASKIVSFIFGYRHFISTSNIGNITFTFKLIYYKCYFKIHLKTIKEFKKYILTFFLVGTGIVCLVIQGYFIPNVVQNYQYVGITKKSKFQSQALLFQSLSIQCTQLSLCLRADCSSASVLHPSTQLSLLCSTWQAYVNMNLIITIFRIIKI